jgi:hypothetical protein
MKPCDRIEVSAELPCCGPDGRCYGPTCWDRKPTPQPAKDIWDMDFCPWKTKCRDWWRKGRTRKAE